MARRRASGWTCARQTAGVRCRQHNRPRSRICVACSKPRPTRRRPEHMAALDLPYEHYIALNGGETCGICGQKPSAKRRLDRDHEHRGRGLPRGLLCHNCNRILGRRITPDWCDAAAAYLRRTEDV